MCGLHWYRQELEKADSDNKRLDELKQMMEERFNITQGNFPKEKKDSQNEEIILLYNEIISRRI